MKVICPKCKKIHKNVDKSTLIYCSCKCLFGVDDTGKVKVEELEHEDF